MIADFAPIVIYADFEIQMIVSTVFCAVFESWLQNVRGRGAGEMGNYVLIFH